MLQLKFSDASLIMPAILSAELPKLLVNDLSSNEVAFLRNSCFEQKARCCDGDFSSSVINIDEMMDTTSVSANMSKRSAKKVKTK